MTTTTEQRVVASKPKIGARPAAPAPVSDGKDAESKGGGKKKMLIVLLVLALAGGGAYWFLLRPAEGGDAAAVEHAPEPGKVVVVDPISLNLANGHYLRIGLGLQMTAEAGGHGDPDTAPALDIAISLFSGRSVEEVSSSEGREALRAEMLELLEEAYHGEVMDLYFTDYVTQ